MEMGCFGAASHNNNERRADVPVKLLLPFGAQPDGEQVIHFILLVRSILP